MQKKFTEAYNRYLDRITCYIEREKSNISDETLLAATNYSLSGNGKRLRPVLMLATAEYIGADLSCVMPFAFSLELIHTHSLVHDDLPALDNAESRRGQPSCHIVYGESVAVLAGDYLLNAAYRSALTACDTPLKVKALEKLSDCAALMLRGQALDTAYAKKQIISIDIDWILRVYELKTSSLFKACLSVPLIISGKTEDECIFTDFCNLARELGLLFQILDDIADYDGSTNSGKNADELNIVSFAGMAETMKIKSSIENNCYKICDKYPDFEFVKLFTDYLSERAF